LSAALRSRLFAGDALLEAVAADQDRISRDRHATDPAVGTVQAALLLWQPGSLPEHGADGTYGEETARAVVRFKVEQLGVDPAGVFDDVGPKTVLGLDEIAADHEQASGDVDPRTREALRAILGDPASPTVATLVAELARAGVSLTAAELAAVMARLLGP
jgi:peptidoglycan hydrolase-like protein with peptidoglycan-binding domain